MCHMNSSNPKPWIPSTELRTPPRSEDRPVPLRRPSGRPQVPHAADVVRRGEDGQTACHDTVQGGRKRRDKRG